MHARLFKAAGYGGESRLQATEENKMLDADHRHLGLASYGGRRSPFIEFE